MAKRISVLMALLLLVALAGFPQSSSISGGSSAAMAAGAPGMSNGKAPSGVAPRIGAQRARIKKGLASHKLSAKQATDLRAKLKAIASAFKADRARDGGHLNKPDMKALEMQLNENSDRINADEGQAR